MHLRKVLVVGANSWYEEDFSTRDSSFTTCQSIHWIFW